MNDSAHVLHPAVGRPNPNVRLNIHADALRHLCCVATKICFQMACFCYSDDELIDCAGAIIDVAKRSAAAVRSEPER